MKTKSKKGKVDASPNKDKKEPKERKEEPLVRKDAPYINLGCCKIKVSMLFAYIYAICSTLLTLLNKIIFSKYKFKFNFIFLLQQQIQCMILFTVGSGFKTFQDLAGEISFDDFYKLRFQYISFTVVFIINSLSSFYGLQLVTNTPMFLNLRKLSVVMTFVVDLIIYKKTKSTVDALSMIFIVSGSLITGADKFTVDYLGYLAVFINNTLSLIYSKFSEEFRNKYHVSNLKLLVYNSVIVFPILFILIFVSGEYKRFVDYLDEPRETKFYIELMGLILLNGFLVALMNSSFFISNEKNSSFFTQLMGGAKDIFITLLSYAWVRDFTPTVRSTLGLISSSIGALLISMKSFLWGGEQKKEDMKQKDQKKTQ